MLKRFILSRSVIGLLFIFLVAIVPLLVSLAQKTGTLSKAENHDISDEKGRRTRDEVTKSVIGMHFVNSVEAAERKWKLDGAQYQEKHAASNAATIDFRFKQGNRYAGVILSEYSSVSEADSQFESIRSYGTSVPFNKFGEKGDKLIGQKGDLLGIRFRKGSFFVVIFSSDLPTAERFAELAVESLKRVSAP